MNGLLVKIFKVILEHDDGVFLDRLDVLQLICNHGLKVNQLGVLEHDVLLDLVKDSAEYILVEILVLLLVGKQNNPELFVPAKETEDL